VSDDLSLAELKLRSKKHNVTINVWFLTCVAMAIKKYHETTGDGKVPQSTLRCESAISTHVKENLDRFEPYNKLTAGNVYMDFKDDLASAIDETMKGLELSKDTEMVMAGEWTACVAFNYMPLCALKPMFNCIHERLSISCSNIAGPRP